MKLFKLVTLLSSLSLGILSVHSAIAGETIKVGITAGPSAKILEVAKDLAKKKFDLTLDVKTFGDYQIPNEALNGGDIDANIFQTVSFLEQAKSKKGYKLAIVGNTFIYPMGIYSKKIKNISEITEKSSIVIPNDPSNQGRALNLLQNAGLIKLKGGAGELPTPKDIVSNPKNLNIKTVDAAQAARAAMDVTAVVLNNDFVLNAGFHPSQALLKENPKTAKPYINVIVVREKDLSDEKKAKLFKQLKEVMNSNEVLKKTEELFPGAVPAW
ncbi:MetQ/NlpA family ABC transporter substrate-binding protein [Silvanigrella aquatica]|uniref:Lipoprotein n=1 Tax=Silvanigrella aquatica TaxID=1915309 RepID=A0A1L4D330_9BACT|nr:MetQ/NlpA family ABC transporter substrate-binding protein [Silvanigrella aquatica]APJ04615.1 hypothetical protein AXG55_12145 [Silvanigrella aquatica]